MARRIDWEKIKSEYVTGDISQRGLIKKYKLAPQNVAKHSKEEEWVRLRKEYRANVTAKAIAKSANKKANELAGVLDASYRIRDAIIDAVNDPQQFNRYLVTEGSTGGAFETTEQIFDKVDTKAIREMTQALKAVEGLIRSIGNINTESELQRLEIERKKFEIEQQKFEIEKEKWEKEKAERTTSHEVRITFDTEDMEGWTE